MKWDVEYTDEFEMWWNRLCESEQDSVQASVMLLGDTGPYLGFPHTSDIKGSRHGNLRELRVQHAGRPYRVLYAFDPRQGRWYQEYVPLAERLYDEHLEVLKREGFDNG